MSTHRAIGPVGTAGRVILGLALLGVAVVSPEGGALTWPEAVLGLIAIPAVLVAWQLIRLQWTTERLNATGPVGFTVNFVVGAALFANPLTRDATFLFAGASLLLAAARGYAGCEVLAVSNWLLRREDHVGCVVFSPLDAIESHAGSGPSKPGA